MSHIVQDLKYAFRGFVRTPGVTLLAVLTLAIGVGANAAIFSVVHNVMIDPLPYPAADRVVIPWRTSAAMGGLSVSASPTDLDNWAKTGVIEAMTHYSGQTLVFTGGDEPEQLRAAAVDLACLDFTGMHPVIGRPFSPDDEASADATLGQFETLTRGTEAPVVRLERVPHPARESEHACGERRQHRGNA